MHLKAKYVVGEQVLQLCTFAARVSTQPEIQITGFDIKGRACTADYTDRLSVDFDQIMELCTDAATVGDVVLIADCFVGVIGPTAAMQINGITQDQKLRGPGPKAG